MSAMFYPAKDKKFIDHPRFAGVRIAIFVKQDNSGAVSVSQLEIDPGVEVPIHTHDTRLDSIYCISGEAEVYINGEWSRIVAEDYIFVPAGDEHGVRNIGDQPLRLFIHHSPPLF
jgi:quercetin dioxygenase-like cupin family protein